MWKKQKCCDLNSDRHGRKREKNKIKIVDVGGDVCCDYALLPLANKEPAFGQ